MAETQKPKAKKNTGAIIAVVSLIIVAVGVVAIIIATGGNTTKKPIVKQESINQGDYTNGGVVILDPENADKIIQDAQSLVDDTMFETYMNFEWHFKSGTSASYDAVIGNSANNKYPIYFKITMEGSSTVLYESNVLAVGTQIKELKLDKALEKGTYNTVFTVYLLNENEDGTYTILSDAGFDSTVIIES